MITARTSSAHWLAACFVVSSMSRPLLAQTPAAATAEVLFRDGRESMKMGDFRAAMEDFSESYRLDPSIGALLNLALCEEKIGHLTSSWLHLRELLEKASAQDERRPLAERRLIGLERRIARVTIVLGHAEPPPSGIRLDGTVIGHVSVGVPLPVDPGEHKLVVSDARGAERTETVSLVEGQAIVMVAEPPPEAATAPTLPNIESSHAVPEKIQVSDRPDGRRTMGIVFGGAGLAVLAASVFPTVAMLRAAKEKEDHCGPTGCDDRAIEAASTARMWNVVATTAAATGLLSLGVGSYFFLVGGPAKQPVLSSAARTMSVGARLAPNGGGSVAVSFTF
jgi:hypothetical protein